LDSQDIKNQDVVDDPAAGVSLQNTIMILLTMIAGVVLVLNLLPFWLPGLSQSASGEQPKVFWYLSRGSAIVAFWLLWLSMSSGVIITNKLAQIWPGIPPAYEIHQYTSLLGLGFALFHALILMGDHYIHYNLLQVLVPFASQNYRPAWVGIGQLAFYIWALVSFSFYVRGRIGKKAWRLIHFLSYASFLTVMLHGIASGSDTMAAWSYYSYWFSGGSLLFLTIYRVLLVRFPLEQKGFSRL
jgi:predicted ferric reductase